MKIKTFGQKYQENNEKFDERINKFIESVEVLDIKLSSGTYGDSSELSDSSTVLVVYRDKTPFSDYLASKKYWGKLLKLKGCDAIDLINQVQWETSNPIKW